MPAALRSLEPALAIAETGAGPLLTAGHRTCHWPFALLNHLGLWPHVTLTTNVTEPGFRSNLYLKCQGAMNSATQCKARDAPMSRRKRAVFFSTKSVEDSVSRGKVCWLPPLFSALRYGMHGHTVSEVVCFFLHTLRLTAERPTETELTCTTRAGLVDLVK